MASGSLSVPIAGLCLFDRLAGVGMRASGERSDREAVATSRACLLRDLSSLLNARRAVRLRGDGSGLRAEDPRAGTVLQFGLPDITNLDLRSSRDRETARNWLQQALLAFEPRLSDLRVSVVPREGRTGRTTFWVEAQLRARGGRTALSFDVAVSWRSRRIEIE